MLSAPEKRNVAVAELLSAGGCAVMLTVGATVSTVQVRDVAAIRLPNESSTCTFSVCAPSDRPAKLTVWPVTGRDWPSRLVVNVRLSREEIRLPTPKLNVAVLLGVNDWSAGVNSVETDSKFRAG